VQNKKNLKGVRVGNDVHSWVDNLENVSPDQKDRLKEYPEEALIYAKKSFQKTSSISFPFNWINRVCENYQTQRPTKQKPKQPHELTGKAKIWAQYDYDLPPTVTPYVTFEMNEKKWQNWLESKRGQNYLLLYGQHSVDKAHDKYVFRSKEWHDDPEGCTKVINDFQKQMFFKTINQTAESLFQPCSASIRNPENLVNPNAQEAIDYFKAIRDAMPDVLKETNSNADERKEQGNTLGFGDL